MEGEKKNSLVRINLNCHQNTLANDDKQTYYQCTAVDSYIEPSHTYSVLHKDKIYYIPCLNREIITCDLKRNCKKTKTSKTSALAAFFRLQNQDEEAQQEEDIASDIIDIDRVNVTTDISILGKLIFKDIALDPENQLIYLFGGSSTENAREPSKQFFVLNLKTMTWDTVTLNGEVPGVEGHSLIKRGNSLYCFCGLKDNETFCNDLYEINLQEKICKKIKALNHDQIIPRSYHTSKYLSKYDVMVTVAGKLKKGPNQPMTNEILIYHFKENYFQIFNDNTNPSPFFKLPGCHVVHSTVVNNHTFAFYGGCRTTNYNSNGDYDPHLYILNFIKDINPNNNYNNNSYGVQLKHPLYPYTTRILIPERISSCYTNIEYHAPTSSFYLYGSNYSQRQQKLHVIKVLLDCTTGHLFQKLVNNLVHNHYCRLIDISIKCVN
ncbi:hypothetical protein ABK040_004535 [Willaertia magna]